MTFLPDPFPERVSAVRLDGEKGMVTDKVLSIGVQIITKDASGLAIVPQHHIVIAIGPEGEPERALFAVEPSMMRAVIKRMAEMCDYAEKANRNAA